MNPQEPRIETLHVSTECLNRLAHNFEISARRWELIVYPSLLWRICQQK